MTIGIVCSGPRAGLAVFKALAAVEKVATGAIGGFAAFAAIDRDGLLHEADTQRGGSRTLFTAGERTGAAPPETIAEALVAGVISSGPDRPRPLSQFLVADPGHGLVSGHRLPNTAGLDGTPLNLMALDMLRDGKLPEAAVRAVLDRHPEADSGLIAADRAGRIFAANSARVDRRSDVASASHTDARTGTSVSVLHNSLGPGPAIAWLAVETAMAVMQPVAPDGYICVEAGVPVVAGRDMAVEIDDAGNVTRIATTDPGLLRGRANGAAIYLGARITRGGCLVGHVLDEPNCMVEDGTVTRLSGQSRCVIGYRRVEPGT